MALPRILIPVGTLVRFNANGMAADPSMLPDPSDIGTVTEEIDLSKADEKIDAAIRGLRSGTSDSAAYYATLAEALIVKVKFTTFNGYLPEGGVPSMLLDLVESNALN